MILDSIDMQVEFIGVDAVNKAAESASNPVGDIAELAANGEVAAASAHSGLLVNLLDLSGVELECLGLVTAKYEHISIVELDAGNRLSPNELGIIDLKLDPALAAHRNTVVSRVLVALVNAGGASVKEVDQKAITDLGFSVGAWHQIDPSLVHDDSRGID